MCLQFTMSSFLPRKKKGVENHLKNTINSIKGGSFCFILKRLTYLIQPIHCSNKEKEVVLPLEWFEK